MHMADGRQPSRVLRFRGRSDPTTAAPDNFYDRELPTDTRELKRIRNRIVILGLLGLAAVLVSWCAG